MGRDYIVIQRYNEGYIGRRYKDSKYIMVKDGQVSQPFATLKGLTDTWKKDQMKWSKDSGAQNQSARPDRATTTRATAEETARVQGQEALRGGDEGRSGDTSDNTASEARTDVDVQTAQEIEATAEPAKPRRTSRRRTTKK